MSLYTIRRPQNQSGTLSLEGGKYHYCAYEMLFKDNVSLMEFMNYECRKPLATQADICFFICNRDDYCIVGDTVFIPNFVKAREHSWETGERPWIYKSIDGTLHSSPFCKKDSLLEFGNQIVRYAIQIKWQLSEERTNWDYLIVLDLEKTPIRRVYEMFEEMPIAIKPPIHNGIAYVIVIPKGTNLGTFMNYLEQKHKCSDNVHIDLCKDGEYEHTPNGKIRILDPTSICAANRPCAYLNSEGEFYSGQMSTSNIRKEFGGNVIEYALLLKRVGCIDNEIYYDYIIVLKEAVGLSKAVSQLNAAILNYNTAITGLHNILTDVVMRDSETPLEFVVNSGCTNDEDLLTCADCANFPCQNIAIEKKTPALYDASTNEPIAEYGKRYGRIYELVFDISKKVTVSQVYKALSKSGKFGFISIVSDSSAWNVESSSHFVDENAVLYGLKYAHSDKNKYLSMMCKYGNLAVHGGMCKIGLFTGEMHYALWVENTDELNNYVFSMCGEEFSFGRYETTLTRLMNFDKWVTLSDFVDYAKSTGHAGRIYLAEQSACVLREDGELGIPELENFIAHQSRYYLYDSDFPDMGKVMSIHQNRMVQGGYLIKGYHNVFGDWWYDFVVILAAPIWSALTQCSLFERPTVYMNVYSDFTRQYRYFATTADDVTVADVARVLYTHLDCDRAMVSFTDGVGLEFDKSILDKNFTNECSWGHLSQRPMNSKLIGVYLKVTEDLNTDKVQLDKCIFLVEKYTPCFVPLTLPHNYTIWRKNENV